MESIPFLLLAHQHDQIRSDVQSAVMAVYEQGHFIMGANLKAFEEEFGRWSTTRYCMGVGNGLDALTMALLSCGFTSKDQVIVPAHTYLATWLAISRAGAQIIPVEPEDDTFNIDTRKLEEVIGPHTKAILPVHLYGQACDMTTIDSLAAKNNLLVVEDNAQSQGAKWKGKITGSWGHINATSFYPSKNLGALGDGGAITTSDEKKSQFVYRIRNYGFESKNVASDLGLNSRLDEIQAAVLRIKLRYLDRWNEERRKLAAAYIDRLANTGDLVLPVTHEHAHHVYHLFVVRTASRDKLRTYLQQEGIETLIHYPIPPHLQVAYSGLGFKKGQFPKTERMAETVLSLPLWPGMSTDQIDRVCDVMRRFFR